MFERNGKTVLGCLGLVLLVIVIGILYTSFIAWLITMILGMFNITEIYGHSTFKVVWAAVLIVNLLFSSSSSSRNKD